MRDIYEYSKRLMRHRRRIANRRNGDLALMFLSHLEALGLSAGRVSKYASSLSTLLKVVDFEPASASRTDLKGLLHR